MSAARTKNVAASVRQRLLNLSKASGEPFDLVLVRYALERFLFRLSISPFADQFVLKGALLYVVWGNDSYRPTRDGDRLRPIRRLRQVGRPKDLSPFHVQYQLEGGGAAFCGVCFSAALVEAQRPQPGQEMNEVQPAVLVAPPDVLR